MNDLVVQAKSEVITSQFFAYGQNNTGGSFTLDEERGITHWVIVEAYSAAEANSKAEMIGLYFDGDGDCSCCGNRWYEAYGPGDAKPLIYGEPADSLVTGFTWMPPGKEVVVHFLDGRVTWYGAFKKSYRK